MILLASTSKYRKALLERLCVPFECQAPICDENSFKKIISDPVELAVRLAHVKAQSLATPDNTVIGGDQVAALEQEILGKPGTPEKAFTQLKKLQGRRHRLITAVCVIHKMQAHPLLNITELELRPLSDDEIRAYIAIDQPLDCAASYKIEKSGIALMKSIQCEDFSAIEGLPLISLSQLLIKLQIGPFSSR